MAVEAVSCVLCGAHISEPVYKKFDLHIARCGGCGLVFANPRASKADIMKRYSEDYFFNEYLPSIGVVDGQYDLDFFDSRYAKLLDLVRVRAGGPGRMLEVGAGGGFLIKAAQRAGWDVVGTEISQTCVDFGRAELGLDIRSVTAEDLEFDEDGFDVVVMLEVIEHLFDPMKALTEIYRVMKPGGLLVISTPNLESISLKALGVAWAVLSPLEHLYYFTERTLASMLGKAGFSAVGFEREYAGFGLMETVNYRSTHEPEGIRARAYGQLVERLGGRLLHRIQRSGRGDTLLCLASDVKTSEHYATGREKVAASSPLA